MPAPRAVSLIWKVIARLEGSSGQAGDPAAVRRSARRRQQLTRIPVAQFVVGRVDRGATVDTAEAVLADGTRLPLRIYRPRRPRGSGPLPVVVNFHGGGWVSGDPRQSEWWCAGIASQADVVIVSVDYRLAPEFPFPTAVEDSYAATVWVAEHASDLEVDGERMAVMGDSAGGNLATVVCQLARDRGGPSLRYQVLIYPAVDLVDSYPSEVQYRNAPVLTKAEMDRHRELYLAGADRADPLASPLRAKLDGLPPALIQVAEHDPLRDQGRAYADALRSADVPVVETTYAHSVHGYISIPGLVPEARRARREVIDELTRVLAAE
jgi:acetyl esterase